MALTQPVDEVERRAATYLEAMGLASNLTDAQRLMFVEMSKAFGLNPFKREIYAIPFWNKDKGANEISILIGYEVYLRRGEESGKMSGWKVWTSGEGRALKAHIQIKRKDWEEPFEWEVEWDEFAQMRYDKEERKWVYTKFWKTKPRTMLKKTVISTGFRLCFPSECGALPYTEDEAPTDSITLMDISGANVDTSTLKEVDPAASVPPAPPKPAPAPVAQPQQPENPVPAPTPAPTPAPAPAPDPVPVQPAEVSLETFLATTEVKAPEEKPLPPPLFVPAPAPEPAPAPATTPEPAPVPAPAPAPAPAHVVRTAPNPGIENVTDIRDEVLLVIGDSLGAAPITKFLIAKRWIKEGQTLNDLTDGQCIRLYRNWSELMAIYAKTAK